MGDMANILAFLSLLITVIGSAWVLGRKTKKDTQDVEDKVSAQVRENRTAYLMPMQKSLNQLNGRLAKVEQRQEDHVREDEKLFEAVHGRIKGVEDDVQRVEDFVIKGTSGGHG